jgi:F0F1-type ATP synthase assembly protein I
MSESKEPPRLPDIVDEAADSPPWLPWIGFAVIGILAFLLIGRQAMDSARGAAKPAQQEAAEPAPTE